MSTFLDIMSNQLAQMPKEVGTAKNHNIETNAVFYHVIQQVDNRINLFSIDSAKHRDLLMKSVCQNMGILPIMNVIMPSHTHDVFLTDDVKKIGIMLRNVNRGTSVFIQKERLLKYGKKPDKVFSRYPGFKPIKSREQFFNLIKYLYDNPSYLKSQGLFVPYSCFDYWEKGYYKPYDINVFQKLFELTIEDIIKYCKELDKVQFSQLAKKLFGNDSAKYNNQIFKKNISRPWSAQ